MNISNTSRPTPTPRAERSSARGFTLVEILVVLAIIAILAGILFPVFSRAREGARRASCASNLKQIGMGLMMYSQDFSRWPRSWFGVSNDTPSDATSYKWMDALQRYVKDEGVFNCPSSEEPEYKHRGGTNYGSYGMNCAYYAFNDNRTAPYGVRPERVKYPSQTVHIVDTTSADGIGAWALEWDTEPPAITEGPPRRLSTMEERHNGTVNVLFCDGHVKALGLDKLTERNAAGTMSLFTNEPD